MVWKHWFSSKGKVPGAVISKEGHAVSYLRYEGTHHYWFPWKGCTCKQNFLSPTSKVKFTLFIEWPLYIYIYIYMRKFTCFAIRIASLEIEFYFAKTKSPYIKGEISISLFLCKSCILLYEKKLEGNYLLFRTNPGSSTFESSNCIATYVLSHKLSKMEQDMLDTAWEV